MVGLLPVDWIIDLFMGSSTDEEQLERLRQVMKDKEKE